MIRTSTYFKVAFLCSALVTLNTVPASGFIRQSEFVEVRMSQVLERDTLSAILEKQSLSFPELVYKSRLDSLQSTVPLDYNEFVQQYIDIYISRKNQIGKMLGLSEYYFPIFEKALKAAGLPDELKFLTVVESSLNPHAVSRSGAVGPWQFMYTTAKGYGLVMDSYVDERKDPVKASYAAAHYFVDAYKRIGDWLLTIAAFNCGTGAVTRAIARSGGIPDFWKVRAFLPKETQNYVPAYIATLYAMKHYREHDIKVKSAGFGMSTEVLQVDKKLSISTVAEAANLDVEELLILNPAYKRQIINGSPENPKSVVVPDLDNRMYASLYEALNGVEDDKAEFSLASRKTAASEKKTVPLYHKVTPGQNLSVIAGKYNMSVQDLKVWNKLKASTVVPGQNIRLSAHSPRSTTPSDQGYRSYIVKVGDTLSGIAQKFNGMTVSKLKALNDLDKSVIVPGMKLIVSQL
jgi:membrane-bound lytic murein transglycosylase D